MEAISTWKAWQCALWSARFDEAFALWRTRFDVAWALWGARFVAMNMTNFMANFVDHFVASWRRLNIDDFRLTFWYLWWGNNGSR